MSKRLFYFFFLLLVSCIAIFAADKVNPLKLCVTISGENGSGSGFFIRREGKCYVVTNNHVILELHNPNIRGVNGDIIPFKQILSATDRDLAFIPIDAQYANGAFDIEEHVDDIWPNEPITCLGDSEGIGVVVACNGKFLGLGATTFEVDALFVKGNSGGPIIRDKSQNVAGVATLVTSLREPRWWTRGTRFADERENAARRFATRLDNIDWNSLMPLEKSHVQDALKKLSPDFEKTDDGKSRLTWELVQLFFFAETGQAESLYWLGLCYDYVNNHVEAVKCFCKAAEQGFAPAQDSLGSAYYYGKGVTQDYNEAVKWYRKAAEQGDARAQNSLGYAYASGNGVAQNSSEAMEWWRKAAEQGNALAQHNLGRTYYLGEFVAQDYDEAVKWYRKAAEQGYAQAQHNLGCAYDFGKGVTLDSSEAVKWYRKAAEQGYAQAQWSLGYAYYYGRGITQDYSEAVKWWRKAAEQGDAEAQFILGICYEDGIGITRNTKEAVKWWRKAAEQGHAQAQYKLGNAYFSGVGVSQNSDEAMKWWRKAAAHGHVPSQ